MIGRYCFFPFAIHRMKIVLAFMMISVGLAAQTPSPSGISTTVLLDSATLASTAAVAAPPAMLDVGEVSSRTVPNSPINVATVELDSARRRTKAVEYSDWYARRLTIHRWASYATLPLFAAQYITGDQLLKRGRQATTAAHTHGPIATAIAGLFGINTVTGVWNLYDARNDPAGRTRRTIHSLLMLTADAGFVWAGTMADAAQNSSTIRQRHKRMAMTSMGVSLVSYAIMLPPFRRD